MAPGDDAAAPECPRHPGTVTYVRCQRCERPTCPACQVPAPVGVLCVDCVAQARKQQRTTTSRLGFVPAQGAPIVTYALIGLNAAFFVFGLTTGLGEWIRDWGMVPTEAEGQPWRVLTSAFVHGGIFHIAINMFVLFQFGSALEQALGRARFLVLYVLSALGGSIAVYFLAEGSIPHVGASGAIFGLIAAYAIVLSKLKLDYRSVAGIAAVWLVAGFFIRFISWQGHLGGAVTGALVMVSLLALASQRSGSKRR